MIKRFVKKALQEDIGRGDLFYLVGSSKKATAKIICKDSGVLAGVTYAKALCKVEKLVYKFHKKDGDILEYGDVIATLKGKSKKLLMCERTILNLLQHSSGIATNTNKYIQALNGTEVKVLDTRKTRPNLRIFEKYSVRCGGGNNHRMGLDDCLMIKDTHLKTIENLNSFIIKARTTLPYTTKIEIECESIEFAKEAMACNVDMIMCDNMSIEEIKKVVTCRDDIAPHILLEASGNITHDTIESYARSGVDAISSGSLIHQAVWLDFSMKITHKEKEV
ncbi:carboxylating nicotinate-nucleotide diphosphorylase [Sulfurospirillum arcachonense]|uniref:carboxylating nicotinate-nucleotide diphosphorylase n=1 Tax=Sulfurospirillum arcachonense TaxID=57666 RepID=UPI00046A2B60|nr:carboxylating nicotinate-nucleotide diphosphorylase [Sulfurospirillum arcachonense]